jgi:hypothetical protein
MEIKLLDKFRSLPDELLHIIINYTNVVVYRHGKYINRLNKRDNRYNLVNNIPIPILTDRYKVLLRLEDTNCKGYFLNYDTSENLLTVNVKFFYIEKDGFDKYYEIKRNSTYLFDTTNKWRKIVDYLM